MSFIVDNVLCVVFGSGNVRERDGNMIKVVKEALTLGASSDI